MFLVEVLAASLSHRIIPVAWLNLAESPCSTACARQRPHLCVFAQERPSIQALGCHLLQSVHLTKAACG